MLTFWRQLSPALSPSSSSATAGLISAAPGSSGRGAEPSAGARAWRWCACPGAGPGCGALSCAPPGALSSDSKPHCGAGIRCLLPPPERDWRCEQWPQRQPRVAPGAPTAPPPPANPAPAAARTGAPYNVCVARNAAPWAYCGAYDNQTLVAEKGAVIGVEVTAASTVLQRVGWDYGTDYQFLCLATV